MRWRYSRNGCLILMLALVSTYANAQLKHECDTLKLAEMYRQTKVDTNRVRVLLRWSTVLSNRQTQKSADLDSALVLAKSALRLSNALGFEKGKEESEFQIGSNYIRTHNKRSLDSLTHKATPVLNVRLLVESIFYRTYFDERGMENSDSLMSRLREAEELMKKEKQVFLATRCKMEIGAIFYKKGQMEEGAQMFVEALQYARENKSSLGERFVLESTCYFSLTENGKFLTRELIKYEEDLIAGYPGLTKEDEITDSQISLSNIASNLNLYYTHIGKTTEGLELCLRLIKLFEANNGAIRVATLPQEVGTIFYRAEKYDLALKYLLMAFSIRYRDGEKVNTELFKFITRAYVSLGKATEGLEFLKKNARLEDYGSYNKIAVLSSFGECYFALGNYEESEKYYLEATQKSKAIGALNEAISYYPLGKLYVKTKQYNKARFYLERTTSLVGVQMVPVWVQRDIQHLLFQADSATGKYLAAIDHLNQFRVLNDSIFNINRNRQIEELKIEFENDKKDAELKTKEQNIQLLTKQSELRQADLRQTRILKNSFIGGGIVLFILLALTYNRFRLKQQSNKLLQEKQDKINVVNNNLHHANQQLQRLLDEKEWLVKEIHHRVKNNLQIVTSLLNTQANHLSESKALAAIRESQQRMQVISLLHQRLYKMEDSRMVNMKTYIQELTGYISEGYKTARHIYLAVEVQEIYLDVSQAVSVGLILNEALTNSYKYAFADNRNGSIKIIMEANDVTGLVLCVSDNGCGLPAGFSFKNRTSMGMRLIKTLSDQLDGLLAIENKNGVMISVQFNSVMSELNLEIEQKI